MGLRPEGRRGPVSAAMIVRLKAECVNSCFHILKAVRLYFAAVKAKLDQKASQTCLDCSLIPSVSFTFWLDGASPARG